jgi:hypothetical protein
MPRKPAKRKAKLSPAAAWKIEDFFIAAAERKGAADLRKKLKAKDATSQVIRDGKGYKIEYYFDNESPHASTFTIYSSGSWSYEAGPTYLEGKLQPPHAKGWIAKMITKGTPGEFAKADWAEYYALRNKL